MSKLFIRRLMIDISARSWDLKGVEFDGKTYTLVNVACHMSYVTCPCHYVFFRYKIQDQKKEKWHKAPQFTGI